jgi:predicted dehydrogenase
VNPLRAGIVGPSGIGRVHADAVRRLGIELTAVAASTPERGRALAEQLNRASQEAIVRAFEHMARRE